MQKILSTLTFIILSSSVFGQNKVTLYGNIKNATSEKIFVWYYSDPITIKLLCADSVILDKEGNFEMTFLWNKPYFADFEYDNNNVSLFLYPNDSLEINIDAAYFIDSLKYAGRGSFVNNYLVQKEIRNNWRKVSQENANKSAALQEKEYTRYIDSVYLDRKDFLKNYFSVIPNKTQNMLDFIENEERTFKYNWVYEKVKFQSFHNYYNPKQKIETLSENYYDFLNNIDWNDPQALLTPWFSTALEGYIFKTLKKAMEKDTSLKDKEKRFNAEIDFIDKRFTNEVWDFLIAKKAYRLFIDENNIEKGKRMLEKYEATSQNKEYLDILNTAWLNASKLVPGKPAPDFNLLDLYGKHVSLSDFKGKVIYIDIWASYCGPCIKEMPFRNKLEEEMNGKDVAFLCISIDSDEKAWRKIIKEKEISGTHLISKGRNSDFARAYNINGIPRYVLIDKKGNIMSSDARNPRDGAKEEIEKLLN